MGDTFCIFCGSYEYIDHLFMTCSITNMLWGWIVSHNGFTFQDVYLDDLWFIDSCIPLKDKLLVELDIKKKYYFSK
jgi:hypothetical protein